MAPVATAGPRGGAGVLGAYDWPLRDGSIEWPARAASPASSGNGRSTETLVCESYSPTSIGTRETVAASRSAPDWPSGSVTSVSGRRGGGIGGMAGRAGIPRPAGGGGGGSGGGASGVSGRGNSVGSPPGDGIDSRRASSAIWAVGGAIGRSLSGIGGTNDTCVRGLWLVAAGYGSGGGGGGTPGPMLG